MTIDFTEVSVSVTQALNAALGTGSTVTVIQPAFGSSSDFLEGALHEYTVRFDHSPNTKTPGLLQIFINGKSKPRVGTIQLKGATKQRCLIATPGTAPDNTFQPVFTTQEVILAGGKCKATLVLDAGGNVADIVNPMAIPPYEGPCIVDSPTAETNFQISVNGSPLQNNSGIHGITFGTGTTTCYGPPRPSIPKCVCTATPCP
ncbi:MAG TPA: hypothetical protein VH867_05820 [Burkholderiales bacterium]